VYQHPALACTVLLGTMLQAHENGTQCWDVVSHQLKVQILAYLG